MHTQLIFDKSFFTPKLLREENNCFSYNCNIIEAKAVRFQDESKSHKKKKSFGKEDRMAMDAAKRYNKCKFTKVVLFLGSTHVKNVTCSKLAKYLNIKQACTWRCTLPLD